MQRAEIIIDNMNRIYDSSYSFWSFQNFISEMFVYNFSYLVCFDLQKLVDHLLVSRIFLVLDIHWLCIIKKCFETLLLTLYFAWKIDLKYLVALQNTRTGKLIFLSLKKNHCYSEWQDEEWICHIMNWFESKLTIFMWPLFNITENWGSIVHESFRTADVRKSPLPTILA